MPETSKHTGGRPRLWTPVFVAILAVALCCFTVGQGINAGTSVYIDRLGGGATLAGIGAAIFSVAAAVARIVCGPLIDSRGRIVVVGVGAFIFMVGVWGAAWSASLDLFVLWRFLQGVGFAVSTTAASTAAADVLPAERLGEGIGYYGLGQAVGMSLGPAIGLALVMSDPAENLYWGMGAFAALAIALTFLCRYEHDVERLPETSTYRRRAEKRARVEASRGDGADRPDATSDAGGQGERDGEEDQAGVRAAGSSEGAERSRDVAGATAKRDGLLSGVIEPGALAGAVPMMVMSPAMGFVVFFAGLFGTSLGVGNASVFYMIGAVAMVAVRLASGSFMDRVAPIKIFAVAAVCGFSSFAMMLAASLLEATALRDALFYLAAAPYGLCLGMAMPVNQTIAVKNSPAERWGAANGMFYLLYDIGIGTGSTIWGITNDTFGFTFTICCVLVLIVVSFASALVTYPAADKRWRRSI